MHTPNLTISNDKLATPLNGHSAALSQHACVEAAETSPMNRLVELDSIVQVQELVCPHSACGSFYLACRARSGRQHVKANRVRRENE